MAKRRKPSVLYVGDWVFHMGPEFVESPFGRGAALPRQLGFVPPVARRV